MALGFDGSIRIDTKLDGSGFSRGIDGMAKSMGRLNDSLKQSISSMSRGIDNLKTSLQRMAGFVTAAFGAASIVNFGREAVKAASDLSDAWMGLESIVAGQGKSFGKAKSFINDYISDGLVPLENAVTSYKNLAARGYSTDQIEKTMTALKDAAAFNRQSTYTMGEAVATATEGLKNENSMLVDNAGVTKNVAKMHEEYAASIGTTAKNLTQEQKIQAEVNGILEETKFQTGDAARLAGTYSGQIAMLSFNFQQLKVAVGEALIPIAQAVLPSINAIIAALTKLAKLFAKVSAMLFGKSTKVVSAGQKEMSAAGLAAANSTNKLADSLGKAGSAAKKAAEEMETAIAPFDEFNIIAFSAAKNAGGAADGLDLGDVGIPDIDPDIEDYEALEEEFDSLADLFVKMLDDILAAMPRFKQALLDFAGNFNDFNQKLYEAFKDPRVVERVERLGRELADALNGLVNAINWELWGRRIGAGLNLALQFLTEFLYNFDWMNLGHKLAEFINGLAAEIDWYDFGRLLWAKFKIALETLAGFIVGLNMPLMADAASKTVMGFFDEMKNTVERIPWAEIGQQIATFLNNIDWYGTITSALSAISSAITGVFQSIRSFIDTLQWSDIATQIYTAINHSMGQIDWRSVGKTIGDLFRNIFDFLREVIANINWFQIGTDIAEFINGIDWVGLLSSLGKLLGDSLIGMIHAAVAFMQTVDWNEIGKGIVAFLKGIDWVELLTSVGELIAEALKAVLDLVFADPIGLIEVGEEIVRGILIGVSKALLAVGDWLGEKIGEALDSAKKYFDKKTEECGGNIIAGVLKGIVDALVGIGAWLKEHFVAPIVDAVHDFLGIHSPSTVFADIGGNIVAGLLQGITEKWSGLVNSFKEKVDGMIKSVMGWLGIHSPSTVFANIGKNTVAGFLQGITEKWKGIVDFFDKKIAELKGKDWASIGKSMIDGIMKGLQGIFSRLSSWASSVWSSITGAFSSSKAKSSITSAAGSNSRSAAAYSLASSTAEYETYKLPKLANGAVIPPNQQFAAILGDQRSGTNIEAPLAIIEKALQNVMDRSWTGGDIVINLTNEMDGQVLTRKVIRIANDITRASGKSAFLF